LLCRERRDPSFSCALLTGGTVKCWGSNVGSALAGAQETTTPTAIAGVEDAQQLATFGRYSCAKLSGGQVKCWGAPLLFANGQLDAPTELKALRGAVTVTAGAAIMPDGTVMIWGTTLPGYPGFNEKSVAYSDPTPELW
jgi:hypothetical protein